MAISPRGEPHENPFQMVYDALVEMVKADSRFTQVVEKGNLIQFGDPNKRDVFKLNPISADYPEVILLTEGVTELNLYDSSSGSMISRQYSWVISTGDMRTTQILPVEWSIFTAMTGWQGQLDVLKWKDKTFVKYANFTNVAHGQNEFQLRNDIKGLSSIWSIVVHMYFTTSDLKDT